MCVCVCVRAVLGEGEGSGGGELRVAWRLGHKHFSGGRRWGRPGGRGEGGGLSAMSSRTWEWVYLVSVGGCGLVGVVLLILANSRRSTCSLCSQVSCDTSTLSPTPSLRGSRVCSVLGVVGVALPLGSSVQVVVHAVGAGWQGSECPHRGEFPMALGGLPHSALIGHSCIAAVLGPVGTGVWVLGYVGMEVWVLGYTYVGMEVWVLGYTYVGMEVWVLGYVGMEVWVLGYVGTEVWVLGYTYVGMEVWVLGYVGEGTYLLAATSFLTCCRASSRKCSTSDLCCRMRRASRRTCASSAASRSARQC